MSPPDRVAQDEAMPQLIVLLVLPLALLFTPFRRCVLIGPIVLAALLGGWMANEALWKATGGRYGECTDVCFEPHVPGSASAAFAPLWALTVVLLVCIVVGLTFLLIRGSLRAMDRRLEPASDVAHTVR
jgi:hypothetical protein